MIKHLACITSGNRVWAKRQGMLPWMGYKHGVDAFGRTIEFCLEKKIPYLTLYLFSIENIKKRPETEQRYLFEVLVHERFEEMVRDAREKGVKIQFLGDRSMFPKTVLAAFEKAEHDTQDLKNLTVNFLFCYGAQQEMVHAAKLIAHKVKTGQLQEDEITTDVFAQNLWTAGIPDPDLIIRVDGETRLSNFLLYQAAYAELYFTDCMWPAVNHEHLEKALQHYNKVKRNFGG